MKFSIFGDSYVTHLQTFTAGRVDVPRCRFFGKSGMSTQRKFKDCFDDLQKYRPDVVFINLGGNDITKRTVANHLKNRILDIVDKLYLSGVRKVFVASIIERGSFPRFTGLTRSKFNKIRRSVNRKLRKELGPSFIDVAQKIKYPRHYDGDLVHPGSREGGLYLLKKLIERCFSSYI